MVNSATLNRTPQVLVVDDDPFSLTLIEEVLKSQLGYSVTTAMDGREALKLATEKVYNLIISDIHMPHVNGNELVRQLRNMSEYRLTPFIFLSGNDQKDSWVQGLGDGADDFLPKPFDAEILMAKVTANLKRFALQKDAISHKRNKHASIENGVVVYCTNKEHKFRMPSDLIDCDTVSIFDEQHLFQFLEENDIWLLLINQNAQWAYEKIDKILTISKEMGLQVTALINSYENEEGIEDLLKKGCADIIIKKKSSKIIAQEINARLRREIAYKSKYLNALTLAANNSPIRLENSFSASINEVTITCYHESYGGLPGGDFYEVFPINENESLIAFGDVMGKKWGAWFFVLAYIAYIRSTLKILVSNSELTHQASYPNKILETLNSYIYKDLQLSEVFTTLSLIYLDSKSSKVKIASAGSLEPLHLYRDTNEVAIIPNKGALLGLLEDTTYDMKEIVLNEGDMLAFYTDGYSEVKKEGTDEMLGDQALVEMLKSKGGDGCHAKELDDYFLNTHRIKQFDDDRTLLIINKLYGKSIEK